MVELWTVGTGLAEVVVGTVSSKVTVNGCNVVSGSESRADKVRTVGVEVIQVETDGSAERLVQTLVTYPTVSGRRAEVPGSKTGAGKA